MMVDSFVDLLENEVMRILDIPTPLQTSAKRLGSRAVVEGTLRRHVVTVAVVLTAVLGSHDGRQRTNDARIA